MDVLSKAELDMLRTAFRRDPDVSRIARTFGLTFVEAQRLLDQQAEPAHPCISSDGWGREQLRRFAVQRKFISDDWTITDELRRARAAYDLGQVELTTARDGDWLILYAIPRRTPDRRRQPYFATLPVDLYRH